MWMVIRLSCHFAAPRTFGLGRTASDYFTDRCRWTSRRVLDFKPDRDQILKRCFVGQTTEVQPSAPSTGQRLARQAATRTARYGVDWVMPGTESTKYRFQIP